MKWFANVLFLTNDFEVDYFFLTSYTFAIKNIRNICYCDDPKSVIMIKQKIMCQLLTLVGAYLAI